MKNRSIGIMVVLFIFTLGIYPIYWNLKFHSEVRNTSGEGAGTFLHILGMLFGFGIYYLYWTYKTGKRLAKIGATDNSVLFLVLAFLPVAWLNPFLMQNTANSLQPAAQN